MACLLYTSHPEVARYEKAAAYLAKHPDDKDSTQKELQQEQETLLEEIAEMKVPLTEVQAVSYTHLDVYKRQDDDVMLLLKLIFTDRTRRNY